MKGRKTLTTEHSMNKDKGKGAPDIAGHDPRVLAFVRFLARNAAEQDYADLLKSIGTAPEPLTGKE